MRRQSGIALLTALLVVALAALLLLGLSEANMLAQKRAEYQVRAEQAYRYAQGLEALASLALYDDFVDEPGVDSRSDRWAAPLPPLPVPGGVIAGRLEELSGRFNINSLLDGEQENALAMERFERLLRRLQLDPAIAAQALDWMDADQETRRDGAEDLYYLQQRPAYRAANRPFVELSELLLLRGVDHEVYRQLRPHVVVLPDNDAININTATVPVLLSLSDDLTLPQAERLYRGGQARWQNAADFSRELQELGVIINTAQLGVQSRWFLAEARVQLDERAFRVRSLLRRDGAAVSVHQRTIGAGD